MKHGSVVGLVCWLAALLVAGCGAGEEAAQILPETGAIPGWRPSGELQSFEQENLYDLVDGQADSYFAFGFENVVVREYESAAGDALRIEVWQLATPGDAYGLFSVSRAGQPVAMGNDGDGDPGRRLDFWQDRYFVRLFAPTAVDDPLLEAFAREVSAKLPQGGSRPLLVERLPGEGMVEHSQVFFHSEISIQDRLWLGGQNVLSLDPSTNAALARYASDEGFGWLLLIEYPSSAQAGSALQTLEKSEVPDLVAADLQGKLLGAVVGQVSEAMAARWLQVSLSGG